MKFDARLAASVVFVCCGLAASANAQPSASEQSGRSEQRQNAQEPQPQASDAAPPEQAPPPARKSQDEHRSRAEDNPKDGGGEAGLFTWAGRWWAGFVGFVEANDKFLVALGTLVTAAFAVVLGGATIALFKATRNLVTGAESTAERQLRAYIGVEEDEVIIINLGNKPEIKLVFKNFGQTPAYQVAIWTEISVMAPQTATFTDGSAAERSRRVMNPGALVTVHTVGDEALTEDEFVRIRADAARLYCYGTIRFTDAFKQPRTAHFRYETRGGRIMALRHLPLSEEGNEAD